MTTRQRPRLPWAAAESPPSGGQTAAHKPATSTAVLAPKLAAWASTAFLAPQLAAWASTAFLAPKLAAWATTAFLAPKKLAAWATPSH